MGSWSVIWPAPTPRVPTTARRCRRGAVSSLRTAKGYRRRSKGLQPVDRLQTADDASLGLAETGSVATNDKGARQMTATAPRILRRINRAKRIWAELDYAQRR